MSAVSQTCSRCNGQGHRAAQCTKMPFYRTCEYCKAVGHAAKACPILQRKAAEKAEKEKAARMQSSDAWSESGSTTASSWDSWTSDKGWWKPRSSKKTKGKWAWSEWQPQHWVLSEGEEREARKLEKKLREIAALEQLVDQGRMLDVLQLEKVDRKSEIESHEVAYATCSMFSADSFYRTCEYCKVVGHAAKACPILLRKAAEKAEKEKAARMQSSDAWSESGSTTASSWDSWTSDKGWWKPRSSKKTKGKWAWSEWQPQHWVLSEGEGSWGDRGFSDFLGQGNAGHACRARKLEKKLREIAALEQLVDQGRMLDVLQLEKVDRKSEIESHEVLRKVRLGYSRVALSAVAE
ncbi:clpC [Symbiodinium natans]|uniref:ClpC protein n=1 Tax=Symbiodinium natans TaxID=878477 RepID=A0A812RLR0_9DINO|nr:clpC [Symbiodinium natans]